MHFYPRPPRGGRRRREVKSESKQYFYPRPPRGGRHYQVALQPPKDDISIHALREEGDSSLLTVRRWMQNFYPRPPRGGRRAPTYPKIYLQAISIHALREEGDPLAADGGFGILYFYPRPPRGGRQQKQRENTLLLSHYTPLCTNCKEMLANQTAKSHRYLRKRLVFRCEASRKTMCAADSHWPDIKRSARCLGQILGAVQRARPWSGSCCLAGRTADCPRQGRSGRSALL